MKNEPVHKNDLNKRQCLALPTQQPRLSRVSGSLKFFLPLFILPALTNVCSQELNNRFSASKFLFLGCKKS